MTVSLFRVTATWRGDSPVRGSEEEEEEGEERERWIRREIKLSVTATVRGRWGRGYPKRSGEVFTLNLLCELMLLTLSTFHLPSHSKQ